MGGCAEEQKKIVIKINDSLLLLSPKDITHIVNCNGFSKVVTVDHNILLSSMLFDNLKKKLLKYGFFAINHNSVVNINNLDAVNINSNRVITLINKESLKISRRKLNVFKQILLKKNT